MGGKEYFRRVIIAEKELYLIRQQREHIREMALGIHGMSQGTVRSSARRSRVEEACVRLADLEDDLNEREANYVRTVEEAKNVIDRIRQPRFREVLTLRYLCGHSWRTVSDEMDYSDPKSVFRVHGLALTAAEKIINVD